jgi:hypothetical protein
MPSALGGEAILNHLGHQNSKLTLATSNVLTLEQCNIAAFFFFSHHSHITSSGILIKT